MAYYLLVRYNVNGGKIAENPYYYSTGMTSYTSYTASTTYKYFKATSTNANVTGCATSGGTYANFQNRYTASATSTLCNLTNVATFHITRDGYHVVDDAEYRTTSTGGNVISEEGSSATKNKPTISRLGGSTTANKTVTVYVNWVGNSYSVRFNASGGSGSMSDQTGFVFGTSKALSTNTFTRTGYTFAGWSKSSGSTTRVFYARDEGPFTGTLGTDGTYLYIRQGYQTYTYYRITTDGSDSYTSLGNTAPSGVSTWVAGGASNTVTCGGNSYYKFEDGNDNHDWLYVYRVDGEQTVDYANGASMSDAAGAIPAADGTTIVNLYAVWTPNTYTVVANTNGGKFNNYSYGQTDSNGWTYQSSTTIQKPIVFNTLYGSLPAETPVNAGYTFNGWYTYASGGYQITPQTLKDDTITNIYAHWTDVAPVITILSTSVSSSNYYASVTFKIVDHSTITGYYVGPSNSPTSYYSVSSTGLETSSSITSSPAYIVAKDAAEHIACMSLPIYKLTANANGGTTSDSTGWAKIDYSTSVKFIPYNAAYTVLPSATRSGYTFDGWFTAASGGSQVSTNIVMGSADTVIYAHWTEHTATLTYNNGGHGTAPSAVTMTYTTATTAASALSASGYTFTGWKRSDNDTIIQPGATVKAANVDPVALTLTAQWTTDMTVTPIAYSGNYDGTAHSASIKINVAGTTVEYGTSTSYGYSLTATNADTNYTMSSVTKTDVGNSSGLSGTTTVYYRVTKSGYTTVTGTTSITISRVSVGAKPTTSVSKTYTGSSQSNGYTTPTGVTKSGNDSGTAVGTYTATYTPDGNHKWSDNTYAAVSVTLTIWAPCVYVKQSNAWKQSIPIIKVSGDWKVPNAVYVNVNGTWKQVIKM